MRSIAIVGGGFCGTLLAARLLQRLGPDSAQVVLIEPRAELGRGVAYGSSSPLHLLNVPAGRMSVDPSDPLQFVAFAQRRDARVSAADFLPRALYGAYLQQVLSQAIQAAAPLVRFERRRARVEALHHLQDDGPFELELSNGERLIASEVVLACGDPPRPRQVAVDDPYGSPAPDRAPRSLVILGTGLTMADVALEAAAGNEQLELHAISRHGLLPQAQSAVIANLLELRFEPHLQQAIRSLPHSSVPLRSLHLVRAFRGCLREAEQRGGDWRDAINAVRHAAPALWQRLGANERGRFLRHLRSRWERHRHRLPPPVASRLEQLRTAGRLRLHAGSILGVEPAAAGWRVRWRVRGEATVRELLADRVIDCTGCHGRLASTREPLLRGLLHSGLALPDALGLGLRTADGGALVDPGGRVSRHLFYLGPMLRADHWEATAVAELRVHAARLAEHLCRAVLPRQQPLLQAPLRRNQDDRAHRAAS
jgi:uncharacterized NAD(P)/FAD-binding protein YdhS